VSPLFEKVLVANRGEIAVRILRTLRELEIPSVAIYSEADAGAPHVELADEAQLVGPGPAAASYLNVEAIIGACRSAGAVALHPGYGFLSENAAFAHRCREEGIAFIGPTPEVIELMGDKIRSRQLVSSLGVPVVPGTTEPVTRPDEAHALADELGYPIAIKASGGGGGIGMRIARDAAGLEKALTAAQADGERFFGNGAVYAERYFDDPRHVEVQVLGDGTGTVIHLGERDCSVQRRHQKLIEETPAPTADEVLRQRIADLATTVAREIGYTNAGTIEGLLVGSDFYFLEMNTRLQVEHAVTEAVTGVDLVAEQLRVAAGLPLSVSQADVVPRGVAIECRVNAEAAHRVFAPSPGTIERYSEPSGPRLRIDSGVRAGSVVTPFYDSLLAKVIVWDDTRADATARMLEALDDFEIGGIDTLLPFHRRLLRSEQWVEAETCRALLGDRAWLRELATPA
jgi:acetyl-CoA/propionyl-CoA carboxylase biotin carboxyl carrier protein